MNLNPWSLFELIDIFGVFVGAFTGALVARRLGYDITGLWAWRWSPVWAVG